MIRRRLQSLRSNRDGVALVEFAMIAPVLLMMLFGIFDFSYNMYANSMLNGAVQKAARDSTLQGASDATIDLIVQDAVLDVVPNAHMTASRKAYANFTGVRQPEEFTDVNGDLACNDGEPFEDANQNGIWDPDQGEAGLGGARDAVLYEVTIFYPRAFPIAPFIGISPYQQTTVTAVLRNQPYGEAVDRAATKYCA
ncbi:MAG: TadE/TadG family type IV pilus assembly protein [Pontixanthobacter sp.]